MVKGKTRKLLVALVAMLAMALFVPLTAQAELQNGNFDAAIDNSGQAFDVTNSDTYEKWLAGGSWERNSEGFAEKTGTGDDILLQGFALPDTCIGSGWKIKVSFDYKNPDPAEGNPGTVKVYAFNDTGSWNSADGTVIDGISLWEANLPDTIVDEGTGETDWVTYQASIPLTSEASNYKFLAIGFDLPDPVTPTDVTYNSAVDNVVVTLVAPVNMKLTPRTLNLKSKGKWVNVTITMPRGSCYTLDQIDTSEGNSPRLTFAGSEGFEADWSKVLKHKFMAKFDRQKLVDMLAGTTGSAVIVAVSGTFNDGVAFEGETTLRVINPGGGSANKPAKPAGGFKLP
ncbi:MAG: hypothetical protein QME75_15070 [Deltaproteobacteria bacterium]|nr:hypothetical protein [Deltaproteobacteria bacterium]